MEHQRKACTVCGCDNLNEIVNLGMHPLADTFIPCARQYESDATYPLICDLCRNCGQVQLRVITDPDVRYSDYSYTSANSNLSRTHWMSYARDVLDAVNNNGSIIEIGSNDGYLTQQFNKLGRCTLGVDPSKAMCILAQERGVESKNGLFTEALATELIDELKQRPALIVANNVLNHANNPLDFAKGVRYLLAEDGTFVFELPHWLRTVSELKFDQIYHEHVSYFTVRLAQSLFNAVGMVITHIDEINYHGGSIRVFVRHSGRVDTSVSEILQREYDAKLFDAETYWQFMDHINADRYRFMRRVLELKASGEHIVCIGAAAKANTFMRYYNLDASIIDWVTDSSLNKIGRFTPGTRIPIASDEILRDYNRVFVIITSWNLSESLKTALFAINPRIEFLNPHEAER